MFFILNYFSTLSMCILDKPGQTLLSPQIIISNTRTILPKYFTEKLFSIESYFMSRNIISNRQCVMHTHVQKYYHPPTYFLVNTSIFVSIDEIILFDQFIKTKTPTPLCFLQIITGSLEVCRLTSTLQIEKITLDCIKYTTSVLFPSHGNHFDIHLLYLITEIFSNCQFNLN